MSTIPYDLLAGLLMVLLVVVLFIIVGVAIRKRQLSKKSLVTFLILLLILLSIPVAGHSEWNRNFQLKNTLQTFQAGDYLTTKIAPEFLQIVQTAPDQLQVDIVSSTKDLSSEPNQVYQMVIDVEGNQYKVRLASYTYPLSWSPYETWVIESIEKQ